MTTTNNTRPPRKVYGGFTINRDKRHPEYNQHYTLRVKGRSSSEWHHGEWWYWYYKRKDDNPDKWEFDNVCPYQRLPESSLGFRKGDRVVVTSLYVAVYHRNAYLGLHGVVYNAGGSCITVNFDDNSDLETNKFRATMLAIELEFEDDTKPTT